VEPGSPTPAQPQPEPQVESREDTIARVEREQGRGVEAERQIDGADPTSRRRVGKRSVVRGAIVGTLVAVLVAVISLAAGGGIGIALGLAAAVLIGSGVVISLFGAMQEDGRIERDVERVAEERK
jgi:hypothetical protein